MCLLVCTVLRAGQSQQVASGSGGAAGQGADRQGAARAAGQGAEQGCISVVAPEPVGTQTAMCSGQQRGDGPAWRIARRERRD